jgi:DNA-binding MarR family transcriptional regulator
MSENSIYRAVNLLITTNRMHKKAIDGEVSKFIGLHRTQHIILMHLAKLEKMPSQKALAEHLGITQAAVTEALKKLICGGYIERCAAHDNRFNEIKITPLGKKTVEQSHAMFSKIDKTLFLGFSDDEIEAFISTLERIYNNILNSKEGI